MFIYSDRTNSERNKIKQKKKIRQKKNKIKQNQ